MRPRSCLAEEGARVVTCGRGEAPGVGEALHVRADLGRPGEPERVVAEAGEVDVLVNNVGLAVQRDLVAVTDEEWDEVWQLNVMSYLRAIRAVLPAMRERGKGVIVNVASTSGKRPSTSMPDYSVTKAAVLSLSRLVADLYGGDGIRCNAVAPGPTATVAWLAREHSPTSRRPGPARPARRCSRPLRRAGHWAASQSQRRSRTWSRSCARTGPRT